MKNDDFRNPFGITILVETVIFIKFRGSNYSCWFFGQVDLAGLCNGFGDFQGRPLEAMPPIGVTILDSRDPLWG